MRQGAEIWPCSLDQLVAEEQLEVALVEELKLICRKNMGCMGLLEKEREGRRNLECWYPHLKTEDH